MDNKWQKCLCKYNFSNILIRLLRLNSTKYYLFQLFFLKMNPFPNKINRLMYCKSNSFINFINLELIYLKKVK